jgi:hypothetical protein
MDTETLGFSSGPRRTVCDAIDKIVTIAAKCVSKDRVCARPRPFDRSNLSRWIGAQFAEVGANPEGLKSCHKFSITRPNQESTKK